MNEADLYYEFDYFGYKIFYKHIQIVHVGTMEQKRKYKRNLEYFKKCAQQETQEILSGKSYPYVKQLINQIDKESQP